MYIILINLVRNEILFTRFHYRTNLWREIAFALLRLNFVLILKITGYWYFNYKFNVIILIPATSNIFRLRWEMLIN